MQTYAFLLSEDPSFTPLISIVSSVLSIAFTASSIFYDKDTDPVSRAAVPCFWGAIPFRGRARVYVAMFVMSASHVLLKVLSTALLATVGGLYVGAYLGGDMLFFLLFKAARNDFRFWLNIPALASAVLTVLSRIGVKLMVDFTCYLIGRHPFEEGGLYFSLSIFLSHASCFVAAYLYLSLKANGRGEDDMADVENEGPVTTETARRFRAADIWTTIGAIESLFLLTFVYFLMSIDRKYIWTFFSTMTGKQFCVLVYRTATSDVHRMDVFCHHPSYYRSIKGELQTWVGENWERWNDEKPPWFTPQLIAMIPDEMIPKKSLEKLRNKGRRKSSVKEQLLLGAFAATPVVEGGEGILGERE